jgi:hypothetical protein
MKNKCSFPPDLFPLSHAEFQCCHKQHLLHCTTTRAVEAVGAALRIGPAIDGAAADGFIHGVCTWGGRTGNRVYGMTLHTPDPVKAATFTQVVNTLNRGNWSGALDVLRSGGIKGLGGISYASKMLRILDPSHCAVLDSVLQEHLVSTAGTLLRGHALWECYSLYCIKKAEELTAANIVLGDYLSDCDGAQVVTDGENKLHTHWTAGDVDMAVFAWLNGWCQAEKPYTPNKITPKPKSGLSYDGDGVGKKPILFIRYNKAGTISVKVACGRRNNLAWIDNGFLNFKDSTVNPFLLVYIQQSPAGQNIRLLPNWSPSPNGATNYGYSTHYEGWLKLESNDDALQFLEHYFTIKSCSVD